MSRDHRRSTITVNSWVILVNAMTDATKARRSEYGAVGPGICRTQHTIEAARPIKLRSAGGSRSAGRAHAEPSTVAHFARHVAQTARFSGRVLAFRAASLPRCCVEPQKWVGIETLAPLATSRQSAWSRVGRRGVGGARGLRGPGSSAWAHPSDRQESTRKPASGEHRRSGVFSPAPHPPGVAFSMTSNKSAFLPKSWLPVRCPPSFV